MNLLEFFFIISWIIILIIAFDIARKQKFNALHFLVFIGVWSWLLTFTFFPWVLDWLWRIFWVARWADVLVYTSIVFLIYFVLLLLTKHVENRETIAKIIRHNSLIETEKIYIKWKEVFLIRAYNEWEVIEKVINEILNKWYKNILVINDWSTDNTLDVLRLFWNKIIVISHWINRWAWAALETWFEYLRKNSSVEYIITFDADWQHDINDLEKFINKLDNNKSMWIVFWSRFIEKTNTNVPFGRRITLFLWKVFTAVVSWIYLTDAHNGYRVLRLSTVKKIRLHIDTMAYASELIEEIKKNKIEYWEVPVNITYSKYSLNKWQSSTNAINIALRIIWSKFFR